MRAFAGEHDAVFVAERIQEIRQLLAHREPLGSTLRAVYLQLDRPDQAYRPLPTLR